MWTLERIPVKLSRLSKQIDRPRLPFVGFSITLQVEHAVKTFLGKFMPEIDLLLIERDGGGGRRACPLNYPGSLRLVLCGMWPAKLRYLDERSRTLQLKVIVRSCNRSGTGSAWQKNTIHPDLCL
jgi:hypothetical protein